MEFFDTHTHYNDEKFKQEAEKMLKELKQNEIGSIVIPGFNIESSERAIELANKNDGVYCSVGIHPSDIENSTEKIDEQICKIKDLTKNEKVVAIGEIGLDYHWVQDNKDLQKYAFKKQIELANEQKLPIIIHTRDCIQDMIDILSKEISPTEPSILHCCPFNRELVKHGLEKGLHIAFGGTCTFKNSKNAEEIVNMVPDNKILIETDCPYLAPEPFRGTRNDSSNLKYIVQKLADYTKLTPEQVAEITYQNASKLFSI